MELKLKPTGLNVGVVGESMEFLKVIYPVPSHWSTTDFLPAASTAASLGGGGGVTSECA